jgi:hypothetical protein
LTYATIYGFDRKPHLIWELMRDFLAETTPQPNGAHVALAELQSLGIVRALVTQNVGARSLAPAAALQRTVRDTAWPRPRNRQLAPGCGQHGRD